MQCTCFNGKHQNGTRRNSIQDRWLLIGELHSCCDDSAKPLHFLLEHSVTPVSMILVHSGHTKSSGGEFNSCTKHRDFKASRYGSIYGLDLGCRTQTLLSVPAQRPFPKCHLGGCYSICQVLPLRQPGHVQAPCIPPGSLARSSNIAPVLTAGLGQHSDHRSSDPG